MSAAIRFEYEKSLYLVNAMALIVLAVVLTASIDTIFCKQNGKITPLFTTSGLHFILLANLIVDWISANLRTYQGKGVSYATGFLMCFGFLLGGYICILAFDYSSPIPFLIFVLTIVISVAYDMYFFGKTSSKIYGLFFILRLSFALMLLVAYFFGWRLGGDIIGVLSFAGVYVLAKIGRLYLIAKYEVL